MTKPYSELNKIHEKIKILVKKDLSEDQRCVFHPAKEPDYRNLTLNKLLPVMCVCIQYVCVRLHEGQVAK